VVSNNRGVGHLPGLVLSLILCLAAPQLSWGAIELPSLQTGGSDLGSPASSAFHIVRAAAKADKTFSSGGLATPETAALHPPAHEVEHAVARPSDPPNLALDCPPLAPRPPPLA